MPVFGRPIGRGSACFVFMPEMYLVDKNFANLICFWLTITIPLSYLDTNENARLNAN